MSRSLMINCGSAVLLKYRPEAFEPYDAITLNCGSLAMGTTVEAAPANKKLTLNAGSTRILEVAGTVVDLGEAGLLESAANYAGCFLVAEEDLIITPVPCRAWPGQRGCTPPRRSTPPNRWA